VCYDPKVAQFVMQYATHVLWNNDVYFTAKTIYQGMLEVLFQVMMLHLLQKDFMPECDYSTGMIATACCVIIRSAFRA